MEILIILFTSLLATTIRSATPLILSTLGGIFSERSGVINIALEGLMLFSAFMAVVGSYLFDSAWIGLLFGVISGFLISMLLALMTVVFDTNHIISGFGINIAAAGIVGFLMVVIFKVSGNTPQVAAFSTVPIPLLSSIPIIGPSVFSQPIIGYFTMVLVPLCWYILYKTPLGLRIRSSGENPAAVDTAGVNVSTMRFIGVGLSGLLAGLAGVYLSLGLLNQYIEGMTIGRGFIALAIVILSGWDPIKGTLFSLFFGLAQAVTYRVDQQVIPPEFLYMLPYILTVIVLAIFGRRSVGPSAEGTPYHNE